MAIDSNQNAESEKPVKGSTPDAAATETADAASPDSVTTLIKKLSDASTPVLTGPVIQVADASGDLTGIIPVVEVQPNLLETQPNVLGDHKTGPVDSLPAPLPAVDFVQPHLSPDAIALNADLIFQALSRKSTKYRSSLANPDVEAIKNILQNMEEVDRQQLEQVFEQKYNTPLRQAFKTYIKSGEGLVTVESILNTKNGETNLAGNAQIALTVLETDPVRGMRMLRGVLGPLNSQDAGLMTAKFQADYGISMEKAITDNPSLNEAQKSVLIRLLGGYDSLSLDQLKEMAGKAVEAKDLGLLSTVIGNNVELRNQLNNETFHNSLLQAFGTKVRVDRNKYKLVPSPIAEDIMREGMISLATILKADTGTLLHFLDNPENTDYVFTHATPKDQRDYIKGRDLAQRGVQPTTAADIEAKRVYDVLEAAIQSRADGPRQAILREQLLFGGKYLVSDLASMVAGKTLIFFGGGYNVSDMLVHIEKNLTEQEFNLLRNQTYKDEFAKQLLSFLKPEEQQQILNLIEIKLKAKDFEDSKSKLRPIETFIRDYQNSGTTNIRQFIDRIELMSPEEAARYKTDATFKKTVDDFAELLIYTGDSQAENALPLIKSLLNQVAQTGMPPVLNELDKLVKEWGFVKDDMWQGMSDAAIQAKKFQTIAQVELILKDPKYMTMLTDIFKRQTNQIAGPVSREEAALTRSLNAILWLCGAGNNAFNSLMIEGNTTIGMAGRVPFSGETVADKASTYSLITTLPKDQLENWRHTLLFDYQKAILENVLTQGGTLTTADKMRVLVTQGGKLTDMAQDFANLSDADFALIEKEYLDKYKSDLKTDLRNTIPQRERMTVEQTALFETILSQNGKVLPIDRMRMLVNGNGGKFQDYQSFFANLSADDWTKLKTDYQSKYNVALTDAILASVTKNESLDLKHQVLVRHILEESNGNPQLVDKLRAFILGDGGKFSDFKQLLKDLTLEQRQKLRDDYSRVFKSNFDNDFMDKVDKAFKVEYMFLLSVTPRDGLHDFFLRMSQYSPQMVADGSDLSLQRMLQINEQVLRQFNTTFKDIPPVVQEALAEYFSQSMQNAMDSNKKYAEFVTNIIMTAASVAAFIAFLPAGVSVTLARVITQEMARKLVVMAALSTSGAVGRPAILASIEGENFDSSPQSLLMNGSLGALEMLLSYPFGMGVLATKTTVALTATQASERLTSVMGKIASLSGNPNDPALAAARAEAFEFLKATGNYSDKNQIAQWRDQVFGALIDKGDPVAKDIVTMAATLTALTNEQAAHQIPDLLAKINAIAPENSAALANARSEAWNVLSQKSGISPEALLEARTNVLQALAAKQDPVAVNALKALSSIDSLAAVSGNELADRLRNNVFQSIISTDKAAADAILQVQVQANQTLTNLLIQKIDSQALSIASTDLQPLKAQALEALSQLSALSNSTEVAALRYQLIQALAKAKDPAAQAALEISSLLEREASKSLDLATLSLFNQKMQQDPALLDAALNLLQKSKAELDQVAAKLITDATTLPANLSVQEISARIISATDQLKSLTTEANAEVVQALRKQATDAIDALSASNADKSKLQLDFYRALEKHDSTAAATIVNLEREALHDATIKQVENLLADVQSTSGNLTELAALRSRALESLASLGDTPEALAMRARILQAFAQSQDPVAKVAVEAFASIKGLSNEGTFAKDIMLAVSRGSEKDLQLIKLNAVRERISTASENITALRQEALGIIDKLPAESRSLERLQLFRQMQDKDPLSKSALQALESLDGLGSESRDRLIQEIMQAIEQGNTNALKSAQISSFTEKILSSSGNESVLMSQALSLISSLGNEAGTARIAFLRAIENKVASAKSAREALERIVGGENESLATTRILGALTSNNTDELARIEVASIIDGIERGGGDLTRARNQLLESIFKLPNQEQQAQRLLGLKALQDKGDRVARAALELNEAFVKASANSLDLVSLAKLKLSLPQDIDAALAAFGRNKVHFNSLLNSVVSTSLERIGSLDAKVLTAHLTSLTEQITASAIDKDIVLALQKELSDSLNALATKIGDLSSGSFELAAIRERALASIETLSTSASKEEMAALKLKLLNALAAKDDPIAKFTLTVKSYFDNVATLKPNDIAAIENLDPTLRNEALTILGRTKEELDQIRINSLDRMRTLEPNLSAEGVVDNLGLVSQDLSRLPLEASDALRDSLKQQMTASIDAIVRDIKAGSNLLPDKRKQAFELLENFSEKGFTETQEAALRSKILEALAAKDDPTAKAAIAALDSVRGLTQEVADARTAEIISAIANGNAEALRRIQLVSVQDQILKGTVDQSLLRKQGLDSISLLPAEVQQSERLKFLTAIADKDPIAKSALNVKNYFDAGANLSVDDLALIEKIDPVYRNEALSILGRTKQEFDQLVTDSLSRISEVKPNLSPSEYLAGINSSLNNLSRLTDASEPLQNALRKQIANSLDSIVNNIRSGSPLFLQENKKEIFGILNSLSTKGFSEAEVTLLRTKLLSALAAQNDSTAKAAIAALDAVRGLENESIVTRNILDALASDSAFDLRRIQIESIKSKILSSTSDVSSLRKEALEAISHLSSDIQQIERLKLLASIADKDPVAKAALTVKGYFDNATTLSIDDIVAIQKLDPELGSQAIELLGRSRQEFEELASNALSRLASVDEGLPIDQSINLLRSASNNLNRLTEISTSVRETIQKQITSSIDALANNIKNGVALSKDQRLEAFELLSKLSERGYSEADVSLFKTRLLDALVAAEDPSAKTALAALENVQGLNNITQRITQIFAALAKDSPLELRQIQIASIQEKILTSLGDLNVLRKQALEAISQLPGDIQQVEKFKFLTAVADKDPVAKSALTLKSYFEKGANLTVEDITALKKLEPTLQAEALSVLGKSEQELELIIRQSTFRLGRVKENQSIAEAMATIDNAVDTITRIEASLDPVREPFRQQVRASIDAIVADIANGQAIITPDIRKKAFQLIDSFSEKGFTEEQEAILRTKILDALAAKEDPTASAALSALDALKGLDERTISKRTTEIIAALSRDSQEELTRIRLAVVQEKILAGDSGVQALRNEALNAIAQLPKEVQQAEKLKLLVAIQNKDPVAKAALTIESSFSRSSDLTIEAVAALENLDPVISREALSILGRTKSELDQVLNDSFNRFASLKPDLNLSDAINDLNLTEEAMNQVALSSPGLRNALKQRTISSIDVIIKEIRAGSELLGAQRTKAFKLINDLAENGFTRPQTDALRNKIVEALAAKDDPAAKLAITALDAVKGLPDEAARTADIFAALTKNNIGDLRQIQISSIKEKIITGAGDVNTLRNQALDAISQLPLNAQFAERIKFLSAITQKDPFAKSAIAINELLSKSPDASFDLIALAKMRAQLKGQNVDELLQALGRSREEFDLFSTRIATSYSESLKDLDLNALSQKITSLTDQLVVSAKDREVATILQQRLTEAVETMTKKMAELPATQANIASVKAQIDTALQTLRNHIGRIEYARLENVLRQSFSKFDQSIAADLIATKSGAALEHMNAAITQIKSFTGKDFVAVRERGLLALKELEGIVDGPAYINARKELLEALASKEDRFAVNVLKRDALRERVANGDFDVLATLERDMKRSIDSKVTNQSAVDFLKAESDAIAELSARATRLQSANTALEKLTVTSDQALIAQAKKEAQEALAAMKPHLNESALLKFQTRLDQTLARLEKPAVAPVAATAEVKAAEVKAAEVKATEVNLAEVNLAQVGVKPVTERLTELTTSIKTFKGKAKELTALRTEALKVLDEAEAIVDAVTLARMRKEVLEALAAQKDDFALKALKRAALREEAEMGKLNPLARLEQDLTKEIERVQARVATLERRAAADAAELAAERRVLQTLQKEQAAAAALRKIIEPKVIPMIVAASVARSTARELYAPNPEQPIKEVPSNLVPSAALMELARVRLGEGPWQSAERILATDGKPHTVAEVRALTRAIQATYLLDNGNSDMSGLPVNYFFVTPDNYGALINAVKDDNIKYLLLGLAN